MEDEVLHIELTTAEINVILRSLGKHPFDEIAGLIAKIKTQGEAQLEEIIQAREAAAQENPTQET